MYIYLNPLKTPPRTPFLMIFDSFESAMVTKCHQNGAIMAPNSRLSFLAIFSFFFLVAICGYTFKSTKHPPKTIFADIWITRNCYDIKIGTKWRKIGITFFFCWILTFLGLKKCCSSFFAIFSNISVGNCLKRFSNQRNSFLISVNWSCYGTWFLKMIIV